MKHGVVRRQCPATGREQNFWQFSVDLYAFPGVARQLLAWQSTYGIWVNDWLFALWSAREGIMIDRSFPARVEPQRPTRNALLAWRRNRRALKSVGRDIYARWLAAEIAMEWADQRFLARMVPNLIWAPKEATLSEQAIRNLRQVDGGEFWTSREASADSLGSLLSALSLVPSASDHDAGARPAESDRSAPLRRRS